MRTIASSAGGIARGGMGVGSFGGTGWPATATATREMRSKDVRAAGVPKGTMAYASSATFEKRARGSFSSERSTARTSSGDTSPRDETSGSGGCVSTEAQISGTVLPPNGGRPEMSSWSTAPRAQMSTRSSTSRVARSCSGAM